MFESIYNAIAKLSVSWDKEEEEFSSKLTQISNNYAGTLLQEKELELRSAHQDKREQLIRKAKSRVDEAYQDIKKQINKKFAYTTSRDAVPDINVLKSLKLTQKDVDVMVEQYRENPLALRIISEVCNEQGLSVIVPTLNAAYDNLEKIKEISEVTIHNVMSGDELGAYLSLKSLKDMTDTSEEALTKVVIGDVDSDIIKSMQ